MNGKEAKSPQHRQERPKVSRLYKKSSNDGRLTIFLPRRELCIDGVTGRVADLEGVVLVSHALTEDPDVKVNIQITLELRYGRDDEELMGLQFSNEMIIANQQIYPCVVKQEGGVIKQPCEMHGCKAIPFRLELGSSLPPTIRLKPTRMYKGSPIGTTYTVTVYPSENPADNHLPNKSSMINMVIWVSESFPEIVDVKPIAVLHKINKVFNGEVKVQAVLDKSVYENGEPLSVHISMELRPPRKIKYIGVSVIQAVDVAMFASGFFKNEVALREELDLGLQTGFSKVYKLVPQYRAGKHWVAIKDWGTIVSKDDSQQLAASVLVQERSLFIIRIMYFVQVRVRISGVRKVLEMKLPFLLSPKTSVV